MYPHSYFDLYPPLVRQPRVFVAMSFDHRFDARFRAVIAPAIAGVEVDGRPLEVHRVDARQVSDSILTEILQGIADNLLVFADVTTIGMLDSMPVRNANVMYELGLAHAVRAPEEVLIFRSDDDPLAFDLANLRVNNYDPDGDPTAAHGKVQSAVKAAIAEQNRVQALAVRRALSRLDALSITELLRATDQGGSLRVASTRTLGEVLSNSNYQRAIERLLDVGAIITKWPPISPDLARGADDTEQLYHMRAHYELTELGRQLVVRFAADQVSHLDRKQFDAMLSNWNQRQAAEARDALAQGDNGTTGPGSE